MSYLPTETPDRAPTIHRTTVGPRGTNDPPGPWRRFVDMLRRTIGLKPLELAERFTRARIQREENEAQAVLLNAVSRFEKETAEAEKTRAEARKIEKGALDSRAALERLEEHLVKLRLSGGHMEIDPTAEQEERLMRSVQNVLSVGGINRERLGEIRVKLRYQEREGQSIGFASFFVYELRVVRDDKEGSWSANAVPTSGAGPAVVGEVSIMDPPTLEDALNRLEQNLDQRHRGFQKSVLSAKWVEV